MCYSHNKSSDSLTSLMKRNLIVFLIKLGFRTSLVFTYSVVITDEVCWLIKRNAKTTQFQSKGYQKFLCSFHGNELRTNSRTFDSTLVFTIPMNGGPI